MLVSKFYLSENIEFIDFYNNKQLVSIKKFLEFIKYLDNRIHNINLFSYQLF